MTRRQRLSHPFGAAGATSRLAAQAPSSHSGLEGLGLHADARPTRTGCGTGGMAIQPLREAA